MSATINDDQSDARFFKDLPAYVVLYPQTDNELRVASEVTDQGAAVLTFVSLFDAVIEVAYRSRIGGRYVFELAESLNPCLFLDARGSGFVTDVRLGWPARDGRILLRSNGAFAGCSRLMHHPKPELFAFEFDADILGEYGRLRELAGLYAWRETNADVENWTGKRFNEVAHRAVDTVEVMHGDPESCNQLAFFDPEFEQWHFVPRE